MACYKPLKSARKKEDPPVHFRAEGRAMLHKDMFQEAESVKGNISARCGNIVNTRADGKARSRLASAKPA